MSAKGLGAASVENDVYDTPYHMVTRLFTQLPLLSLPRLAYAPSFYDPCAGSGALLRALRTVSVPVPSLHGVWKPLAELDPAPLLFANELRPECEASLRDITPHVTLGDALRDSAPPETVVITNPPFSLFGELAEHYVSNTDVAATILLGRASWLFGCDATGDLIDRIGMPDVYGFRERPSFIRVEYVDENGKRLAVGGTDSVGAAWYVWPGGGGHRGQGKVELLRKRTAEERAFKPPTRRLWVTRADWEAHGKKATVTREEWLR